MYKQKETRFKFGIAFCEQDRHQEYVWYDTELEREVIINHLLETGKMLVNIEGVEVKIRPAAFMRVIRQEDAYHMAIQ